MNYQLPPPAPPELRLALRNLLLMYLSAIVLGVCIVAYLRSQEPPETLSKAPAMRNNVGYSTPQREGPDAKRYRGARSFGPDWEIRWAGPYNTGPTAIDAMRSTLNHLTHLQATSDAASTVNAKLINHLVQAIEEFDGVAPTMGGDRNRLIPSADDE